MNTRATESESFTTGVHPEPAFPCTQLRARQYVYRFMPPLGSRIDEHTSFGHYHAKVFALSQILNLDSTSPTLSFMEQLILVQWTLDLLSRDDADMCERIATMLGPSLTPLDFRDAMYALRRACIHTIEARVLHEP